MNILCDNNITYKQFNLTLRRNSHPENKRKRKTNQKKKKKEKKTTNKLQVLCVYDVPYSLVCCVRRI